MGAWPLPTGDSLVVPSRAQVYLIGPCDRSFQTTPLRLTMSSGREAHRRRDTEAGGCASPWHGSLQPPEGPPELQIRLPDVELKSTGGVLVKDFKYEVARSSVEPTSNGEACCRRCVPAVSFHLLPLRRSERTECTGRQMGGKKRGAAGGRGGGAKSRGRPPKQMKLTDSAEGFLPEIKDPKSVIGVQIEIPGSFWSEFCKSLTATEKSTMYKCTVRAFDAAHDFSHDEARWAYRATAPKGRAFQLHEFGPDGKGSLELGDSSGAAFWLPYREFQKYYYLTFPDKKSPSSSQQAASGITSPDACTPSPPAGMHPQFPNLKVSTATVFTFFDVVADTRITDETHARCGSFMAEFMCTIVPAGGGAACGRLRKVIHADQKGISTSNLISHLEEGSKTCQAHAAALEDVRKNSKGYCLTAEGQYVPKFSFKESFPHHVNFVYCLCDGLTQHLAKGPSFRDYVSSLQPRVTIPCNESIHRLLHCIALVQKEERLSRYAALRRELKSEFLGLQLDCWFNPADKSSYACITVTTICEPKRDEPQRLDRRSEVISFAVFEQRKFAENIRDWFKRELAANNIVADDVSGITPDGASDGQAGLRLIDALAQKVDTCHQHQLQSAIKWALGLSGQPCQNKAAKKLIQVNFMQGSRRSQTRASLSTRPSCKRSWMRASRCAASCTRGTTPTLVGAGFTSLVMSTACCGQL